MNVSKLNDVVGRLLDADQRHRVSKLLNEVQSSLNSLVSSPSDASHQNAFVTSVRNADQAIRVLRGEFSPADFDRIAEINGADFFAEDLAEQISKWVSEKPATPAVAQERLTKFLGTRSEFVGKARQLRESLNSLGAELGTLEPGEAEIGILLPREFFRNEFDKLIKDLGVLNRILRAFSEAATGSAERVEVRQISTTDPIFTLGLSPETILAIGGAITWALCTWKKVEEIRKLRAETENIEVLRGSKIEEMFSEKIKETISNEIESKTKEIVGRLKVDEGRKNEQRIDLAWALESILARIERGMTVEIRMLPPIGEQAEGDEVAQESEVFQELREVSSELSFPRMEGSPVMRLPNAEPPRKAAKPSEAKSS